MRPLTRLAGLGVVAAAIALSLPVDSPSIPEADAAPADQIALIGTQGLDTSLPATPSAVTVNGRGPFADLSITVNQTRELTNQAVSVTWTGGAPTIQGSSPVEQNFLQIMQCWGEPDGTNPDNPGPPPEQCVQGAVTARFGGVGGTVYPQGFSTTRIISREGWATFDPEVGVLGPGTPNVWREFRAVNGDVIGPHTDPNFNPDVSGGAFWLNPYFDIVTTNEITNGRTGPNGRGAELFQVLTGVESSGLGCGQRAQPTGVEGQLAIPQCWLVIVPRGTGQAENVDTQFAGPQFQYVATSPLSESAWEHRIAVPLDFTPVDSPCEFAQQRRLAGSELPLLAVNSWQPALCSSGELPPYSYVPVSENSARLQLSRGGQGAPGMIGIGRPLEDRDLDPDSPVVYAPLTVSALGIGFNIQRLVDSGLDTEVRTAASAVAGVRVAELNLTPRLVAKLLAQSYGSQVRIAGRTPPDYDWLTNNPVNLDEDPDFLRFNPEFEVFNAGNQRRFGGLSFPQPNSDAARLMWEWIFADEEAMNWLAGNPDEWGMRVNPLFSTNPDVNPQPNPLGATLQDAFPKPDPFCYQAATTPQGVVPPPLCSSDWMPYSNSLFNSAQITRAASDRARIGPNSSALTQFDYWTSNPPQPLGSQSFLAVTDTPSAARFGVQMARLSRAGDLRSNREFVAPDEAGMRAGVRAMERDERSGMLLPNPGSDLAGAYPLTSVTYAAIKPLALDAEARSDFAAFISYASDQGQVRGLRLGQLPPGFVPLPAELTVDAALAAFLVVALEPEPEPVPTTTTPQTTPSTTEPGPTDTTAPSSTTPTVSTTVSAGGGTTGGGATGGSSTGGSTTGGFGGTTSGGSTSGGAGGGSSSGGSSGGGSSSGGNFTPSNPVATTPPATTTTTTVTTVTTVPATAEDDPATDDGGDELAAPQDPATGQSGAPGEAPVVGERPATPSLGAGASRLAIPSVGVVALLALLVGLEITKRPRRMSAVSAQMMNQEQGAGT